MDSMMAGTDVQIWSGIEQIPADYGPSVVTLGNFDGVHRGHQEVLRRVVTLARSSGARAVAVTFDPHPGAIHRPDTAPPLLTDTVDRVELIGRTGVDAVLVLPYSLEFAKQSPEEFVARYLAGPLGAERVVVGHDVRFGWQNAGDLDTMIELGRQYGFDVDAIDDLGQVDAPGTTAAPDRWSSTFVRELLTAGDVARVREVLGRAHSVRGEVVHGDARGRDLGFPTANLGRPVAGMIPADGVYAGWLERVPAQEDAQLTGEFDELDERRDDDASGRLPAAISIGTNPTFDGVDRRVEAYVLDRTDLDLYGDEVRITFVERLRPTLRFDSVAQLIERMTVDVDQARQLLRAQRDT